MTSATRQRALYAMVAVLLLAAAARLINVSGWPVWTDEAWTIWATGDPHFDVVVKNLEADRHPPGYFLALSAWRTVAGDSRLALRFLAILGGVLTVALTYRIGADWFDERSAWIAALLLAILSLPVYFSQEVRNYGWLTLAICLMTLFFLRYLQRPRRRWLIGYALAVAFMLYVQYIGIFVLAVQVAFGLLIWRGSVRQKVALIGAWVAAGVLYAPWIPFMILHLFGNVGGGGFNTSIGADTSTLPNLINLPNLLFDGQLVVLGSAYALGVWALRRRAQVYVALAGAGLFAALYVFNLKISIFMPRTLVYLLPMLVIVCGYGLMQIKANARGLLLALLTLVIVVNRPITQARIDADGIARQVAAESAPGDLVVLEMGWDNYTLLYELGQAGNQAQTFVEYLPKPFNQPNEKPVFADVRPLLDQYSRVWVLNWLEPSHALPILASDSRFQKALNLEMSIGDQFSANTFISTTVTLTLFERSEGTAQPFGDQFELHNAIFAPEARAGQAIPVDLWWSALKAADKDYSVGVYLLDGSGMVRAQQDGAPGSTPTTQWGVGSLMFDRHVLTLPPDLPPGTYRLAASVYWYGDQQPIPVEGQRYAVIGTVEVR